MDDDLDAGGQPDPLATGVPGGDLEAVGLADRVAEGPLEGEVAGLGVDGEDLGGVGGAEEGVADLRVDAFVCVPGLIVKKRMNQIIV